MTVPFIMGILVRFTPLTLESTAILISFHTPDCINSLPTLTDFPLPSYQATPWKASVSNRSYK